jgi:integrase
MACVRKRRNKWIVDYRVGNQRRWSTFSTKAEAETYLRELRLRPIDVQVGYQEIKDVLVGEAVSQYLKTITPKKSERTWSVDQIALDEIAKFYDKKMVWEVSLQSLESFQLGLAKGLNPATVNRKFNVIKNFFRKCVEWKYVRENPSANIKRLMEFPQKKHPLSSEQISKIIEEAPAWASSVIYLIAKTGIRRGEACSVKWEDVDFDHKAISVRSKKGGVSRVREIPMTDDVHHFLLTQWNERKNSFAKNAFVFTGPRGLPIDRANLSKAVTQVGKRFCIENAGLHILRHTILTKLSEHDQSGSTLQKLAGHSSLVTTQRYIHHSTEALRESLQIHEGRTALIKPKKISESFGS